MEFSIHDRNRGKKMTGVIFAVLFHIALIWALMNGLGTHLKFDLPKPPIDITVVSDPKPVDPPPLKPVDVKPVDIHFVPPVIVPPTVQLDNDNTIKVTTAVEPDRKDIGIVRHGDVVPAVRVPPVMDANACERPEYPINELTRGIEGTTVLQFLVGANGKVMDSKIARSSGSPALDRAALTGLMRCPFKAATADGKAEAAWTKVQYVWRIEQE